MLTYAIPPLSVVHRSRPPTPGAIASPGGRQAFLRCACRQVANDDRRSVLVVDRREGQRLSIWRYIRRIGLEVGELRRCAAFDGNDPQPSLAGAGRRGEDHRTVVACEYRPIRGARDSCRAPSVRVGSPQRVQGFARTGEIHKRPAISADGWGVSVCQDRVGRRILRGELRQARTGAGARGKDQSIRCPGETGAVGYHGLDGRRDVTSTRCGAVANPDVHLILGARDRECVAVRRKAEASIGAEIVGQA